MKIFIGDISKEDAIVLEHFSRMSQSVLEFGAGGSTMVMSQSLPVDSNFICVETEKEWIDSTRKRIQEIKEATGCEMCECNFIDYPEKDTCLGDYLFDMIFVDGTDDKRLHFSLASWRRLVVGGYMLFHDTRRVNDIKNVLQTIFPWFNQIKKILPNYMDSNITLVQKGAELNYVNWNLDESKTEWMAGRGTPPENWIDIIVDFYR